MFVQSLKHLRFQSNVNNIWHFSSCGEAILLTIFSNTSKQRFLWILTLLYAQITFAINLMSSKQIWSVNNSNRVHSNRSLKANIYMLRKHLSKHVYNPHKILSLHIYPPRVSSHQKFSIMSSFTFPHNRHYTAEF